MSATGRLPSRRAALLLPAWPLLAAPALAQGRPSKPRVPAGRDPGGVAVAILGGGINYLDTEVARRLARDGEGEPIAWDFEDGDNRPLERGPSSGPATAAAGVVLAEAPAARLIVTRDAPGDATSAARGLALVARTPARIALVLSRPDNWQPLLEATAVFGDLLVIVAAGLSTATLAGQLKAGGTPRPANLLAVAATPAAAPAASSQGAAIIWPTSQVDIDVPPRNGDSDTAAARVAALAARLVAAEPRLAGTALKSRILSLARRPAAAGNAVSAAGTIAEPDRIPASP